MSSQPKGFSLVEMLITLVLLGILASLAYPSYAEQLHRARRADAWDALARLQLAQERHRSRHTQFADTVTLLSLPATSPAKHYQVRISEADAQGYALEASPMLGSPQARDAQCQRLRLIVLRGVQHREAFDHQGMDSTRRCFAA